MRHHAHADTHLDLQLLEPFLRQLVGLIGASATMTLVDHCGGTLLDIPRQADRNAQLVALIGAEKAAILGRALGPDRRFIPKAGPALRAARNRQILAELQSSSVRQVARRHRLGERMVWYIKSQADADCEHAEPDLFG